MADSERGSAEKRVGAASAISLDRAKIADFCRRHHVRRLSFFGSILRDDFGPESDVDMLVEFEPESRIGLFEIVTMEYELADLLALDRKVDLRTPKDLSRYFRDAVVAEAELIYAAA